MTAREVLGRIAVRTGLRRASPLEGGGERVDIDLTRPLPKRLNIYQLSHLRRYEFAAGLLSPAWHVGDFACGTGYGSILLGRQTARVVGGDLDRDVIDSVRERYAGTSNVEFEVLDLNELGLSETLDAIVSFETLEHFSEDGIAHILQNFSRALKPGGTLILSTPYLQENSPEAQALGFHQTFLIDEAKITSWLDAAGLAPASFSYQNYSDHTVVPELDHKDFVVCVARKRR